MSCKLCGSPVKGGSGCCLSVSPEMAERIRTQYSPAAEELVKRIALLEERLDYAFGRIEELEKIIGAALA